MYRNPADARWVEVEQVLVFPTHPTKRTSVAGNTTPTGPEYTAIIQFVDGTHMQASTDTVGPELIVARAEGRRAVRKVSRRR